MAYLADEFEGWDEREAAERRRQELLARYDAGGLDDQDTKTISLFPNARPDPDLADKRDRFEDDTPAGIKEISLEKDHLDISRGKSADEEQQALPAEPLGEWDAGDDDQLPSPRGWLLGNTFCRQFISSVVAPGGVGKSALRLAQLISLAIGRALTGEHVFMRCRVLLVSLEDDADELRRRLRAVCLYHGVTQAERRAGRCFRSSACRRAHRRDRRSHRRRRWPCI